MRDAGGSGQGGLGCWRGNLEVGEELFGRGIKRVLYRETTHTHGRR